jgi:hypothetical protein
MESRKTIELCSKLYKTEKYKYFWVFEFLRREQKETGNKEKSFWIFEYQTETRW